MMENMSRFDTGKPGEHPLGAWYDCVDGYKPFSVMAAGVKEEWCWRPESEGKKCKDNGRGEHFKPNEELREKKDGSDIATPGCSYQNKRVKEDFPGKPGSKPTKPEKPAL